MRHYNVFMSVAHDSLLYSRVETVLAREITDGNLKVGGFKKAVGHLSKKFSTVTDTLSKSRQRDSVIRSK